MDFQKNQKTGIKIEYLCHSAEKFIMVTANRQISPITWLDNNREHLDSILLEHGAVLLRNFDISSLSEFNKFAKSFSSDLLDYTFRSTPRQKLGGQVYTATEYPAAKSIPLHNENSYCENWPNHILFFCAIPAKEGGETPIVDSREVFKSLDEKVIKKFEDQGILYVRNYTPGIDLSWQEVFQTENRPHVENYCDKHNIEFIWGTSNELELTTKHTAQVTLIHPKTQEKVWFNQAHLFHFSAIDAVDQKLLLSTLGTDQLPRNSFYKSGNEIELSALEHIRETYKKHQITFKWQFGDILILDNILTAHGRKPFKGERKIAVAMA